MIFKWSCPVVAIGLICLLASCSDRSETSESEPGQAAEVPGPGSDVELGAPGPAPSGQSEPETESSPAQENKSAASEAEKVTVEILDWDGIEQWVASQKGKVVVLDLWALTCPPCRKEFPGLVQLHNDLGDRVSCASVSLDYEGLPKKPVEAYQANVLEFLQQKQATLKNFLCRDESDAIYNRLKLGSIPAVYVYNQQGKLARRFADPQDGEEHTYADDIRPFVEGLLSQQ